MSNMLEKLNEHFESLEGKAELTEYFENLANIKKINIGRFVKFSEWLKHNDFDKLLYRLILEHDEKYKEYCYEKGCEPYLTNLMQFIFDYVIEYIGDEVHIKEFECGFPHHEFEFKGYYFGIMYGQGTVFTIWNKEDKQTIFSI